jgi:hypothetical protein
MARPTYVEVETGGGVASCGGAVGLTGAGSEAGSNSGTGILIGSRFG